MCQSRPIPPPDTATIEVKQHAPGPQSASTPPTGRTFGTANLRICNCYGHRPHLIRPCGTVQYRPTTISYPFSPSPIAASRALLAAFSTPPITDTSPPFNTTLSLEPPPIGKGPITSHLLATRYKHRTARHQLPPIQPILTTLSSPWCSADPPRRPTTDCREPSSRHFQSPPKRASPCQLNTNNPRSNIGTQVFFIVTEAVPRLRCLRSVRQCEIVDNPAISVRNKLHLQL